MTEPEVVITITVGRLCCRPLRDYLNRWRFLSSVRFHEGAGWFERTFTIAAPPSISERIRSDLNRWRVENPKQEW